MNDTLPSATIVLLSLDVTEKELVPGEMIKWLMPRKVLDRRLQTSRSWTSVGTSRNLMSDSVDFLNVCVEVAHY